MRRRRFDGSSSSCGLSSDSAFDCTTVEKFVSSALFPESDLSDFEFCSKLPLPQGDSRSRVLPGALLGEQTSGSGPCSRPRRPDVQLQGSQLEFPPPPRSLLIEDNLPRNSSSKVSSVALFAVLGVALDLG